jgi:hypothetical protein
MRHSHKFTIADEEAVRVLAEKLLCGEHRKPLRDKILRATAVAARRYKKTNLKERQAFFHGLLTGYAVALKL